MSLNVQGLLRNERKVSSGGFERTIWQQLNLTSPPNIFTSIRYHTRRVPQYLTINLDGTLGTKTN